MPFWDSFEFTVRVNQGELMQLLVEVEAYRRSIQQLPVPPDWAEELRRLNITRAVHGTTALEGNPLAEQQVELTIERADEGEDGDTNQAERQVVNAYRAHDWVRTTFEDPRHRLSLDDMLTMHRLLTEGSDESDNEPGRFREEGHVVTAGSPALGGVHHSAPGGPELVRLLEEFLEFLHSAEVRDLPIVERALLAHFYLVTIHPFGNGNGRTARCVEASILYQNGYNTHGFYSLANYLYANREEYVRLLQRTRNELAMELTEFFAFGLHGFASELARIASYLRRRTERLMYRDLIRRAHEMHVGPRRRLLNDREQNLLHYLLDSTPPPSPFTDVAEPAVTLARLISSTFFRTNYEDVTRRTVSRELNRLAELGFIHYRRVDGGDMVVDLNFEAVARH